MMNVVYALSLWLKVGWISFRGGSRILGLEIILPQHYHTQAIRLRVGDLYLNLRVDLF